MFKVNINDKLSKIIASVESITGSGGQLVHQGQLIDVPEDLSFQKAFATFNSVFMLSKGAGAKPPIEWVRFKSLQKDDYFYMEKDYPDAVCFKPNLNVFWQGFGMMSNWHGKEIKYLFAYALDDEEKCDWIEFTKGGDAIDKEREVFLVTMQDLGLKPIKIAADQKLHLVIKIEAYDSETRRHRYGRDGYPDSYRTIEGQDQDFEVENSRFNNNSTSQSWGQFPIILYSK